MCLKWNIVPSRFPETSVNAKKALVVFQVLVMKMWKHLPLSVGGSSWPSTCSEYLPLPEGGRSGLSACSECSKPWVPTQTRQIVMMGVLTTETEMTPLLGLIGSLPMVTAQAHIC